MKITRGIRCLTLMLSMNLAPNSVTAQDYPSRTITIVVPLAAGAGMDIITRVYAEELQKSLGKPVVVENQPGAALMLAAQNVSRAAPDGHTLLVTSAPVMAVNPTLYKKINYEPDGFVPIALYAKSPFVLIVNPAFGTASVKDFFAKAGGSTAKPLNYATSGSGTIQNLAMEILKREFKAPLDHVAYRSSPQIVTDIVGGHINSAMSEIPAALTLIKDKQILALGVTSSARHVHLPDVPTIAEATGMQGFDAVSWHALMALSGTPPAIVARLNAEMTRISGDPGFQKRVVETGLVPEPPSTTSQIHQYILKERQRWSAAVKALGLEGTQ